jgi:hypothetical protein
MALPIEKLDTSRPYGSEHGEQLECAFRQKSLGLVDLWPYDSHHNLIESLLTKEQKTKLTEKREAAKNKPVEPEVESTEDELLEPDAVAPKAPVYDETEEVNLVMWLKGEARYKSHELQKAMLQRYKVNKRDHREIARWLVEEAKVLPRAQVHPSILPPLVTA